MTKCRDCDRPFDALGGKTAPRCPACHDAAGRRRLAEAAERAKHRRVRCCAGAVLERSKFDSFAAGEGV